MEGYIEKNSEFILNKEEITNLVEELKLKRKEMNEIMERVKEGDDLSIEEEKSKDEFKNLIATL